MQRVCSQSVGDHVGGRCEAGNQGDTLKAQHGFLLSSKWPKGIKSYVFGPKSKTFSNIFNFVKDIASLFKGYVWVMKSFSNWQSSNTIFK